MCAEPIINITIPVFNRTTLTEKTILAVGENTSLPHVVTVVDNGSDGDTRRLLKSLKRDGHIDYLLRLEANFGVAVAANVGWRMVRCPLYMKLDNDVVIHSPDWLEVLLGTLKGFKRSAVIGGDFHNQLSNTDFVKERRGLIGKCHSHVSGGAIIIPRDISDIVGYWCEDYGLYGCEDGDYGSRLNEFDIDMYYFNHKPFMKHLGQDHALYAKKYSLNKRKEQNTFRHLWLTNTFLYESRLRAPNIPQRFVVESFDGYRIRLTKNTHYQAMFDALMELHEVLSTGDEITPRYIDALNRFVSIQNSTWDRATAAVTDSYEKCRLL